MRAEPTRTLGAAQNGSGASLEAMWDSSESSSSKQHFYQGGNHSQVSNSWWKFDAEL